MSNIDERRCELCQSYHFYYSEIYEIDKSECRCNPPNAFVYEKTFRDHNGNPTTVRTTDAYWPKVSKQDWCGKFIKNLEE